MYFFVSEGEELSAFVELRLQLTLQCIPCGPDEEDCVLTMAKCIWRKQRKQQFQFTRAMSVRFDPGSGAYDEIGTLQTLLEVLQKAEQKIEVERALQCIGTGIRDHLARCCPNSKYRTARAWIRALLGEIEGVLLPAASRFGDPSNEILLSRSAAVLTDDNLDRELAYERKLDAEFDRAMKRLFQLKAAKRNIGFWERRHWQSSLLRAVNPMGGDDAKER
jgi:hypothetical protein